MLPSFLRGLARNEHDPLTRDLWIIPLYFVLFCFGILSLSWYWTRPSEEVRIQRLVESRYRFLLEHLDQALDANYVKHPQEKPRFDAAVAKLQGECQLPELYRADLSTFDHRGEITLKAPPTDSHIVDPPPPPKNEGHGETNCLQARASTGEALYIYQVFRPETPVKHQYALVFYADKLKAMLR